MPSLANTYRLLRVRIECPRLMISPIARFERVRESIPAIPPVWFRLPCRLYWFRTAVEPTFRIRVGGIAWING